MGRYLLASLLALALVASAGAAVHADAPALLPLQGYLVADDTSVTPPPGTPYDGTYAVRFRLYDAPTAGNLLHDEELDVAMEGGFFTVYLGDVASGGNALDLSLFRDHTALYLGVSVQGGAEASPRLQLATAPFAAQANYCAEAATLAGQSPSAFAAAGHTHAYSSLTGIPTSFTPAAHAHSASDVTSGTLGNGHFSAYSDLTAEGYLDNNAAADLLTRSQGDGRYAAQSTLSAAGTINTAGNPVDWTQLKGVPAGFADGTDADSGGDITGITTSSTSGLSGGCTSGTCTLGVTPSALFGSAPAVSSYSTTSTTITDNANYVTVQSLSITTPRAGLVVAMYQGYYRADGLDSGNPTACVNIGFSTSSSGTPAAAPTACFAASTTGVTYDRVPHTSVLSVSAGTTTVYVRARLYGGPDSVVAGHHNLTLFFLPT